MPLNTFIVRPFGTKEVIVETTMKDIHPEARVVQHDGREVARLVEGEGSQKKALINFDVVQDVLIAPALAQLGINGETAAAVVAAGNIREDMFHRLLTADLVIADLSIHNANVFYELGIRQAFRDKYTFVLRCNVSDYPFDLRTDRYFEYQWDAPWLSLDSLVRALRATISSDKADSPVFKLLPTLEAEDRSRFISVPRDFTEEVERAQKYRRPGDLRLFAIEAEGSPWEIEGLREVGRAQFELNFVNGAQVTWEAIVGRYPDDLEANTVLSTIYQRLNDLARSEQALARVSRLGSLNPSRLSQIRALHGRNLKARWVKYWKTSERAKWQERALWSPLLQRAYDAYAEAFKADLNNAYAGLNALTLLIIQTELAGRHSELWKQLQVRPEEASRELDSRKERIETLLAALQLAVESECERLQREGRNDFWFGVLQAAVACIVSRQPERVAQMYQDATLWAPPDAVGSMREALQVYKDLGIEGRSGPPGGVGQMTANIDRALAVLSEEPARAMGGHANRIVIFSGLRVDREDQEAAPAAGADVAPRAAGAAGGSRKEGGRFPRDRVGDARTAIREAVAEEKKQAENQGGTILLGIASGAGGGDILFHQVCRELGIDTRMFLALPKDQYLGEYVAPAGRQWVEDFIELYRGRRPDTDGDDASEPYRLARINVLANSPELPRWLQGKPYYNIGRRNNLWMLQHALVQSILNNDAEVTLIVLWDGETRGGTGGFQHTISLAERSGIKVRRIDPGQWLRSEPSGPSREPTGP